jgi:putative ATP-dependent endonuclease of the OLD family
MYLRSFDVQSGKIEDEPEESADTVLAVQLIIASDLEPSW